MNQHQPMYSSEDMELNDRIEQIEISIEEANKLVQQKNDLEKLSNNREFKRLVLEGYFKNEASRLAFMMNEPGIPEENRKHVERDLMGPAAIQRYFRTIMQRGQMAEQELKGLQEEGDLLRNEALNPEKDDDDAVFGNYDVV